MTIVSNEWALGLAAYQAALAVVGILVLLWLVWRAARTVIRRWRQKARMTEREVLALAWPPLAWSAILVIAGVVLTTMQAYGPRVSIPQTKLEANAPDSGQGEIRNLAPKRLTDEERLRQQRALEDETKRRVNLKE